MKAGHRPDSHHFFCGDMGSIANEITLFGLFASFFGVSIVIGFFVPR